MEAALCVGRTCELTLSTLLTSRDGGRASPFRVQYETYFATNYISAYVSLRRDYRQRRSGPRVFDGSAPGWNYQLHEETESAKND